MTDLKRPRLGDPDSPIPRDRIDGPGRNEGFGYGPCPAQGCPGVELYDGHPEGCGHPTKTSGCEADRG